MTTVRHCRTAFAIATVLAASGAFAATASRADYAAAKDRIDAEYKADREACSRFSDNDKDVCLEKAKRKEKISTAELQYNRTGNARDAGRLATAKADSDYAVAKEVCDAKSANAKDVCMAEAKAAHTKAIADAKLSQKVGDARADANRDKREADYKLAAEKCDSLAGDAKDSCVKIAKARYKH